MTVPVVEAFESPGTSTDSPVTLTRPSGLASGETALILVGNDRGANTAQWDDSTNKPSGFDLIETVGDGTADAHAAAFIRIADGTEAGTIDVPYNDEADSFGWYLRVTGAAASDVLDGVSTGVIVSGDTSHEITGLTTSVDDCLVFYLHSFDGGDGDPFSVSGTGWTEGGEVESGATSLGSSGCWGTKEQVTAGATGSAIVVSSASDGSSGFQFAIRPGVDSGGSETGGASLSSGAGGEFSASVVARGARSDSVVGEDSLFASAGAIAVGSSGASLGSSIAALASALASLSGGVAGGDSFIADASASVALSFESVSGSSQLSIAHCIAAIASGIEAGDAWVGQVAALGEISSGVLSSEDASGSTNGSQSAEMVAGVASSEVLAAIAATVSSGSLAVESADTSVVAAVIGAVFSDGSASSSAFVSSAAMLAASINSSEAGNELETIASVLAGMMAGAASASDMTFATAVGYLVGVTRLIAALDGVASSRSAVDGDTSLRASLDGLTTLKSD